MSVETPRDTMSTSTEPAGESAKGTGSAMKWLVRVGLFVALWIGVVLVRWIVSLVSSPGFIRFLLTLVIAVLLTQLVLNRRADDTGTGGTDTAELEQENERLKREIERLRGVQSGATAVKVTSISEEAGGRYAVLRNVLEEDRDLAGEIVVHESGARYQLPDDLSFRPGENVRLLARGNIEEGDTMMLVERLSVDSDEV